MPALTGSSHPIEIAPGGYRLQAPGLVGSVEEMTAEQSATRGDAGLHEPALLEAVDRAGVFAGPVFEIKVEAETPATAPDGTRADGLTATTREGEPAVVLEVPHLQAGAGYAVLYTDEAGLSRWVLPEGGQPADDAGSAVFHLPRASAPTTPEMKPDDAESTRGPISKLGRRVVRVLAWAGGDLIGEGVRPVAKAWEDHHRPYDLHLVTAERYVPPTPLGDPVDWDWLRQGRALLLLHGTFSTAQASFAQMERDTLQALATYYQGRVLAFNHPSLHVSPADNVQALLDALPPGIQLELDIMTHSRGGLVGRELVERLAQRDTGGRSLNVRKALLVASPNQGTILSDPEHGLDLLDRYTNLITLLPDNAWTLTIEAILVVVKLLGYGALQGLPGLRCLRPKGEYLDALNRCAPHNTRYYAMTADFTPSAPALLARLGSTIGDKFIDSIFKAENDAVVPTQGCYEAGPASFGFPLPQERVRVYRADAQVHHCNYFSNPLAREQIVAWLTE